MRQVKAAATAETDFEARVEDDFEADGEDLFVTTSPRESARPESVTRSDAAASAPTNDFVRSPLFHTSIRVAPAEATAFNQDAFADQQEQREDTPARRFDRSFAADEESDSDMDWFDAGNDVDPPMPLSPFAGASNAYDETGGMDELDIPAFLRRPSES
jgi:hypothetical protein